MATLYMLVAVDVRRANSPGSGRPDIISKITLPSIRFINANHNPGGGVISVDYVMPRIEPPEPAFEVKGVDTNIFDGFGKPNRWVFSGAWRDPRSGKMIPSRAVIEGAIAEWEPDESDPAEFQGCRHIFREVSHYEFRLDGKELWYVDRDERILRVSGKDYFAEVRRALG